MNENFADQEWYLFDWPFFDAEHHEMAERAQSWAKKEVAAEHPEDLAAHCRAIVSSLGEAGLLDTIIPPDSGPFDARTLCIMREALTYEDALFDAMYTMQGIGTLAIQNHGTDAQKSRYLPGCRAGTHVAAFALTEPEGGSDVAATATTATRTDRGWVIDGRKTLISNAGFADHYLVVARTGEAPGAKGLSVFIVDADAQGMTFGEPIEFIAEHPAASITFDQCRVPIDAMVGEPGMGFAVAMGAFDIFRPSVGAAGVGLARRSMAEALQYVRGRTLFGKAMSQQQGVQMTVAKMASDIDTAALAVYRAAWINDRRGDLTSYAASMAKLVATEAAGRVADTAIQLSGGAGVTRGNLVEKLYREARAMRIYEGASEVQSLIIGRGMLKGSARP